MIKKSFILLIIGSVLFIVYSYKGQIVINLISVINGMTNHIEDNRPINWTKHSNNNIDQTKPNIIFILADDLGFNDISLHNKNNKDAPATPNIDALAKSGVVFTNGYAASATCSPSRASIMTGRYSTRFGFDYTPYPKTASRILNLISDESEEDLPTINSENVDWEQVGLFVGGMPSEEVTIAEVLQNNGYYTALVGKWHLGGLNEGMRPSDQGFEDSLMMTSGLYLPKNHPDVINAKADHLIEDMIWASSLHAVNFNNSKQFQPDGYLTDYLTEEAIKVINNNKDRPFFLYLSHWAPHNPLQSLSKDYQKYSHMNDHTKQVYSGMITALDRSIGEVVKALKENGIADNTIIIFTSDNGGAGYIGLDDINKPYRGWKMTFFEGGMHVPFLMKWPNEIDAGQKYEERIHHVDIFHTILGAANIDAPTNIEYDGVDLLPYIKGENKDIPHDALFWKDATYQAVISEDWKLIRSELPNKQYLYNLKLDPFEKNNLIEKELHIKKRLNKMLDEHVSNQKKPLYNESIYVPVLIDKPSTEKYKDGDDYTYWIN